MPARWLCLAALAAAVSSASACASASQPQPTFRPDEVQVIEPAGQPERWTYAPGDLAVAAGTTVSFVNHGKEFHTVTADAPSRPFDLSLDTGQTATFTFSVVGVFTYHCGVHPQMKGVVRVCDRSCA